MLPRIPDVHTNRALLPEMPALIEPALQNPFNEKRMTTIGEQLKAARAQLAEARQEAANAVADSADAARVGIAKINEVKKETADFRAELAEITNGGPA